MKATKDLLQKKYVSVISLIMFYHNIRTALLVQKNNPIKKITPKIIKLPKILKNIFNKLNHKKNKVNIDDNGKPSKNSPENPFTKENESS